MVKNPPAKQEMQVRSLAGEDPWVGNGNALQWSLVGCSPWGCKESGTAEHTGTPTGQAEPRPWQSPSPRGALILSFGEGNAGDWGSREACRVPDHRRSAHLHPPASPVTLQGLETKPVCVTGTQVTSCASNPPLDPPSEFLHRPDVTPFPVWPRDTPDPILTR